MNEYECIECQRKYYSSNDYQDLIRKNDYKCRCGGVVIPTQKTIDKLVNKNKKDSAFEEVISELGFIEVDSEDLLK